MKNRNFARMFSFEFLLYVWLWLSVAPQWGAADAEIKVPSGENTELKSPPCDVLISSFMTSSRVVYVIRCHDVSF